MAREHSRGLQGTSSSRRKRPACKMASQKLEKKRVSTLGFKTEPMSFAVGQSECRNVSKALEPCHAKFNRYL